MSDLKIINIMASSLDGCISRHNLESDAERWDFGFNCQEDRDFLLSEVEDADAIITGAQSVRASQTLLKRKNKDRELTWFVLSEKGLAKEFDFWKQTGLHIYLVSPKEIPIYGDPNFFSNLIYTGSNVAKFLYQILKSKLYQRVLLFGGGQINSLFYQENLVDELRLTLTPTIIAQSNASPLISPVLKYPVKTELVSKQQFGSHLFLHYKIIKSYKN